MKENTDIDQLFEEQLADLKVEPKEHSWEKISSSLDAMTAVNVKKSKRKKRFILIAFASTVAALFAYVLFFGQSGDKNAISFDKQQAQLHKQQQLNNSGEKTNVKPALVEQNKALEDSENHISVKTIDSQTKLAAKSSKLVSTKSTSISKSNQNIHSSEGKAFDTKNTRPTKTLHTKVVLSSKQPVQPSKTEAVYITKPIKAETTTMKQEKLVSNENQAAIDESATQATEVEVEEKTEEKAQTFAAVDTQKKEESTASNEAASPSPTEVAGVYASTGWSLDLIGGPAFISSNESISLAESDMFQQTDKKSHIITPSLGLNINYHYNNWFVRSGLTYAEFGENKEYLKITEMHDTVGYSKQLVHSYYSHDTTGWMQDPGDPSVSIPIYDAVFHSDTTYAWVSRDSLYYEHQNIYAQNRYRYIEIPLMVGYEMRFKNFGLEVATGVSVGFRVNSSGSFIDSNKELVNINSSNSPYSNTMMNYMLSVGIKYHIGSQLSIVAQPIYKTNLNSLFTNSNDIRYHNVGLNLGLNYIIK